MTLYPKRGTDILPRIYNPRRTALIICDMRDQHWCASATERTVQMALRINTLAGVMRDAESLIIHAPSDTMDFYLAHPVRRRLREIGAPPAVRPVGEWERKTFPPMPIDYSDGGCDCPAVCEQKKPGTGRSRSLGSTTATSSAAYRLCLQVTCFLKEIKSNKISLKEAKTMSDQNPAADSRKIMITVLLLFVLPFINEFFLSFIYEYIAGDILYETVAGILYYVTQVLSFVLPYVCFGTVIASVIQHGVKKNTFMVSAAYISLLIPYLCEILVKMILFSNFRDYVVYYLAYTVLNYVLLDGVILTFILFFTVLFKRKIKKRNPLFASYFMTAALLFTVGLIKEAVETVRFIYELLYEYYTPITFNELVSLITSYLMLAAKAAVGYVIMRLSARIADNQVNTGKRRK